MYREVNIKLLKKQKKLIILKIFAYILTRDYNNSKTRKKEKKKLKLNRNYFQKIDRNMKRQQIFYGYETSDNENPHCRF